MRKGYSRETHRLLCEEEEGVDNPFLVEERGQIDAPSVSSNVKRR